MQEKIENKLILNAKDLSYFLGISLPTIYALMKSETFPSFFVGKQILVRREKFIEWLEMNERKGCNLEKTQNNISPSI